jgi:hypothetical protein
MESSSDIKPVFAGDGRRILIACGLADFSRPVVIRSRPTL